MIINNNNNNNNNNKNICAGVRLIINLFQFFIYQESFNIYLFYFCNLNV